MGKPSKGTPKDRRLKENQPTRPPSNTAKAGARSPKRR